MELSTEPHPETDAQAEALFTAMVEERRWRTDKPVICVEQGSRDHGVMAWACAFGHAEKIKRKEFRPSNDNKYVMLYYRVF